MAKRKGSVMFSHYMVRFVCRILIVAGMFYLYFTNRPLLNSIVDFHPFESFGILHVLWIILMGGMLLHLLPKSKITMSARKSRAETYTAPETPFERLELLEYVQSMNIRAWRAMMAWLIVHACIAALYLFQVITVAELLMLTMLYFLGDLVCILLFCPFQTFFMKNRCCVNCRIFDWGHFFMYTPMLMVPSFFGWSLFFTACVVLIRWELSYAKHPERFWRGSNTAIRCENCSDRICRIKKPLNTALGGNQAESQL